MQPRPTAATVAWLVSGEASSRRHGRVDVRRVLYAARPPLFPEMLWPVVCVVILLGAGGVFAPVVAQTADAPARTFRIGRTGIMCVRPPCPSWGIVAETSLPGERRGWPLWGGDGALPVRGPEAAVRRIAAAWRARACLRVEGRWTNGALDVQRVVGACSGR